MPGREASEGANVLIRDIEASLPNWPQRSFPSGSAESYTVQLKLSLCRPRINMGQWNWATIIPNLGTRWTLLINLTPYPLHSRLNCPRSVFKRRQSGKNKTGSTLYWRNKNLFLAPVTNPNTIPRLSSPRLAIVPTELPQLPKRY